MSEHTAPRSPLLRPRRAGRTRAALVALACVALPACRKGAGTPGANGGRTCGQDVAPSELWARHSAPEFDAAIEAARGCARGRGARVLLEFVATWCEDCQAMTRLEQLPVVATVLRERYERVRINVGEWDAPSAALRQRYGIDRIAAYVVLDPQSGQRVAQRVVEPVTGNSQVTPESWAAWLRDPR